VPQKSRGGGGGCAPLNLSGASQIQKRVKKE